MSEVQRNRMDEGLQNREQSMNVPRILAFRLRKQGPFACQVGMPGATGLRLKSYRPGTEVRRTLLTAHCDACHRRAVTSSGAICSKPLLSRHLGISAFLSQDSLPLSG